MEVLSSSVDSSLMIDLFSSMNLPNLYTDPASVYMDLGTVVLTMCGFQTAVEVEPELPAVIRDALRSLIEACRSCKQLWGQTVPRAVLKVTSGFWQSQKCPLNTRKQWPENISGWFKRSYGLNQPICLSVGFVICSRSGDGSPADTEIRLYKQSC